MAKRTFKILQCPHHKIFKACLTILLGKVKVMADKSTFQKKWCILNENMEFLYQRKSSRKCFRYKTL